MSRFTAHIGDFGNTGGWGSSTEHAANLTGDRDCGCSGSEFPQKSQSTVTISGDSLWDGVLMNTKFNLWRGHLGSTVNSFCVRYQLRNGKHCLFLWNTNTVVSLFVGTETPQVFHCWLLQRLPWTSLLLGVWKTPDKHYYLFQKQKTFFGYWPAHKYRTHFYTDRLRNTKLITKFKETHFSLWMRWPQKTCFELVVWSFFQQE